MVLCLTSALLLLLTDFARAEEPAPATAGALYIGDSHSAGTFGRTLNASLRKKWGANLGFYAASSATPKFYFEGTRSHGGFFQDPPEWAVEKSKMVVEERETPRGKLRIIEAPTPLLSELIAKTHPATVYIALGGNLLRQSLRIAPAQISQLLDAVREIKARCIWISPPDKRDSPRPKQEEFFKLLTEATRAYGCEVIDSRKYTRYPDDGGDGTHFDSIPSVGKKMAAEWAAAVAAEIARIEDAR